MQLHRIGTYTNFLFSISYCNRPPRNLDSKATVSIDGKEYFIKANDMQMLESLGSGAYGVVEKFKHLPTGKIMAVKVRKPSICVLRELCIHFVFGKSFVLLLERIHIEIETQYETFQQFHKKLNKSKLGYQHKYHKI